MDLQSIIANKKNSLKPTTTTVYLCNGEVHVEKRDECGQFSTTKLDKSNPGYIIDIKPDLSVSFVLPWLCMGSQDVAQDDKILNIHRITHILSIGVPIPQYQGITTIFKEAYDIDEFNLTDLLDECCIIIESVRKDNGIIYVHCNAGISRSASVVIAYLIYHKRIDFFKAFDIVRNKRPKIKPNPGFQLQLQNFAKRFENKSE